LLTLVFENCGTNDLFFAIGHICSSLCIKELVGAHQVHVDCTS